MSIKIITLSNPGNADDLAYGKTLIDNNGNLINGTYMSSFEVNGLIARTISGKYNGNNINIKEYVFAYCSSLTSVSFPACTSIGSYAFYSCTSLTSVSFPVCTTIGGYAFYSCSKLASVSFPSCTTIGSSAFRNCSSLTSVDFPACTTICGYAFYSCSKLASVSFPACTSISSSAFNNCSSLTSADFPACTSISSSAFYRCTSLTSLTLEASSVCTLANVTAFYSTPMSSSTYTGSFGSIYVPASLVSSYKSATNWVTYSNRITGIIELE